MTNEQITKLEGHMQLLHDIGVTEEDIERIWSESPLCSCDQVYTEDIRSGKINYAGTRWVLAEGIRIALSYPK